MQETSGRLRGFVYSLLIQVREETVSEETPMISLKYESDRPVDLITFTNALTRFGSHYQRFAKKSEIPLVSEEYRLFIKEVRKGSIEVDLVTAVGAMASVVGDAKLFLDFGKEFFGLTQYFLGKGLRPSDLDKQRCEDVRQIVAPVAENTGSVLNMNFGDNAKPRLTININSVERNAIQNSATREIERLKEPTSEIHEEVLLRWHRAENAPGVAEGSTADRAVIEEVDEKPRKVYFSDNERGLKDRMIHGDDNPFERVYMVDVEVLVTQRRIVGYKVLRCHDVFDLD